MTGSARRILGALGACLLAAACSGPNWNSGENNQGTAHLRRWKVTDASGKVLSSGCTQQSAPGPAYCTNVITVQAATGSIVTYEDNLGMQDVDKSRGLLEDTDAYWCSNKDMVSTHNFGTTGLEAVEVTDADPPATVQKIALVNPTKDSQNQTSAEGIRLQLKILHPGVLHLGFLVPADADAGGDAGVDSGDAGADAASQLEGVYPAMTIQ